MLLLWPLVIAAEVLIAKQRTDWKKILFLKHVEVKDFIGFSTKLLDNIENGNKTAIK